MRVTILQTNQLYMLLTLALFSLATDYTATSYIYQSLGDVEWFIEMKLSSWQQWVTYGKSPRRSQCSQNRSLEPGTDRLAIGGQFGRTPVPWVKLLSLLSTFLETSKMCVYMWILITNICAVLNNYFIIIYSVFEGPRWTFHLYNSVPICGWLLSIYTFLLNFFYRLL